MERAIQRFWEVYEMPGRQTYKNLEMELDLDSGVAWVHLTDPAAMERLGVVTVLRVSGLRENQALPIDVRAVAVTPEVLGGDTENDEARTVARVGAAVVEALRSVPEGTRVPRARLERKLGTAAIDALTQASPLVLWPDMTVKTAQALEAVQERQ